MLAPDNSNQKHPQCINCIGVKRVDIIGMLVNKGIFHLAEKILSNLDGRSLARAEEVCANWRALIEEADNSLWRKSLKRNIQMYPLWKNLGIRRGWVTELSIPSLECQSSHNFFRNHYISASRDLASLNRNWQSGRCKAHIIDIPGEEMEKVYIDDCKIVSKLFSETIKVWNIHTLKCVRTIIPPGRIRCMWFHDNILMASFDDCTLKLWEIDSGLLAKTIKTVRPFWNFRFDNSILLLAVGPELKRRIRAECKTTSGDSVYFPPGTEKKAAIAVWELRDYKSITIKTFLNSTSSRYDQFRFDKNFIVCLSSQGAIDVWSRSNFEFLRTVRCPPKHLQSSFQFKYPYMIIGFDIEPFIDGGFCLWDVDTGTFLGKEIDRKTSSLCLNDTKICHTTENGSRIRIRDLETRKCLSTIGHEEHGPFFSLQSSHFLLVGIAQEVDQNFPIVVWDFLDADVG